MEKQFGKRVASDHGNLAASVGNSQMNNINGNYSAPYMPQQYPPQPNVSQSMPNIPMNQANQYLYPPAGPDGGPRG